MKHWFAVLVMVVSCSSFADESTKSGIWSDVKDSLSQTWQSKDYELYIPVNTWHNRSYYSAEKIASFNEQPWGLGLGKYRLDVDGDWLDFPRFSRQLIMSEITKRKLNERHQIYRRV